MAYLCAQTEQNDRGGVEVLASDEGDSGSSINFRLCEGLCG